MVRPDTGAGAIGMRKRWRGLLGAIKRDPAFALYLIALAALGLRWLSPLTFLSERAIWSDLLIAASALVWAVGQIRSGRRLEFRTFHVALGLFAFTAVLSSSFAVDRGEAATELVLILELITLAVLTSEFASDPARVRAIVLVIAAVSIYSAALAAVGLALFYADVHTSLLGAYGEQFIASDAYARVQAGFFSPPLLASYCIFASAVLARDDVVIPRKLRLAAQVALAALVISTLSRGIIGFAAALAIRAGYRHRHSRPARIAATAFVVAAIALMVGLTAGRLHLDPTRPSTITYEVPDPHNRREAFSTSLDTLAEHPFVGTGPGSLAGENRGVPFRAHLTPLNIAATMGLPALAAATFLIVTLWRNRRRPTPIATWSGLAGLGIDAMAQDVEHFRHVWVMIGLADADRDRFHASRATRE